VRVPPFSSGLPCFFWMVFGLMASSLDAPAHSFARLVAVLAVCSSFFYRCSPWFLGFFLKIGRARSCSTTFLPRCAASAPPPPRFFCCSLLPGSCLAASCSRALPPPHAHLLSVLDALPLLRFVCGSNILRSVLLALPCFPR